MKILSKLIPKPIPDKYQKGFSQFILYQNLRNTVLFSCLMLGIHILFLLTDFFHYTSGGWENNFAYHNIVFRFHLIVYPVFGSVLVIAKLFQKRIESLSSKTLEKLVMIYIMVTASWLVSVAAYDQVIHGKIPLYIVYTMMGGIVFTLNRKEVLFAQLFGYGLLVIGIYSLQPNTQKMIGILINGAGFATIGFFVSVYFYRKRGEAYIREQLLTERTRELNEMNLKWKKANTELMEVNDELKTFVYAVSHDLKAPLRMVNSFTSLLERSLNGSMRPESKEYMSYISNGTKKMNVLLDDLRDYAMVNKGDLVTQYVDLNLVVHQVQQNLQINIEESNATIEVKSLPTVKAVFSHTLQLFQNLISNAIKFRKDIPPKISIQSEERNEDYLFSVSDNGIGIEPEYLDQIFTLFKRLHTEQEYEGTGIGLAICQKIISSYGGQIWLESAPQNGTTFYFTIPKTQHRHSCL